MLLKKWKCLCLALFNCNNVHKREDIAGQSRDAHINRRRALIKQHSLAKCKNYDLKATTIATTSVIYLNTTPDKYCWNTFTGKPWSLWVDIGTDLLKCLRECMCYDRRTGFMPWQLFGFFPMWITKYSLLNMWIVWYYFHGRWNICVHATVRSTTSQLMPILLT